MNKITVQPKKDALTCIFFVKKSKPNKNIEGFHTINVKYVKYSHIYLI